MSDLPRWPDAKPEHLGLANSTYWEAYERARAEAAIARLRVAVALLGKTYSVLGLILNITDREIELHDDIHEALEDIGEIP